MVGATRNCELDRPHILCYGQAFISGFNHITPFDYYASHFSGTPRILGKNAVTEIIKRFLSMLCLYILVSMLGAYRTSSHQSFSRNSGTF